MPRTVLVTEGDSPLGAALIRLFLARGCSVVSTRASRQGPEDPPEGAAAAGNNLVVSWNRRSPVSAHTVVRSALNAFPSIEEALILEPPCDVEKQLLKVESAAIDRAFDDARGPVFLAREILGQFAGSGGVLCLVSRGPAAGPVESAMRECFRGMASSLLAEVGKTGPVVNGFQQGDAEAADYAAFIDRTLEEKGRKLTGRWFTCSARGGLFQGAKNLKRG
jgi:NAD(P)-dependent dehydrogenase (short-subunit alcohol dehydrogenase family)